MFYKDDFDHSVVMEKQNKGPVEDCSYSPISSGSQWEISKEGHTGGGGMSQWQVQAGKSTRTTLAGQEFVGGLQPLDWDLSRATQTVGTWKLEGKNELI